MLFFCLYMLFYGKLKCTCLSSYLGVDIYSKVDGIVLKNEEMSIEFEFVIVDRRGGEVGEGTVWSCQLSSAGCYFC